MNEEATPGNTKSTCLVNNKITIPLSVERSDLDIISLLRGSVNINHYSSSLQGIVVNYSRQIHVSTM